MNDNGKETEVKSVADFLQWLESVHESEDYTQEGGAPSMHLETLYFRGQADKTWDIIPSLFRPENSHIDERKILQLANLKLWNVIGGYKTQLEKLIFLQHYGLCTRLLDVSFNPLIALYMACCEDSKGGGYGAIYCGYKTGTQLPKVAELSADFLFNSHNDCLDYFLNHMGEQEARLNIGAFAIPRFILPPINNSRIEKQDGAFIMMPVIDKEGNYTKTYTDLMKLDFFDERRAVVADSNKKYILKTLSEIGINQGTVYGDIGNRIKAIMNL